MACHGPQSGNQNFWVNRRKNQLLLAKRATGCPEKESSRNVEDENWMASSPEPQDTIGKCKRT